MSEIELKKQKAFQLIQEFEDENIIEEVVKIFTRKEAHHHCGTNIF